jgi:hypothetical protein
MSESDSEVPTVIPGQLDVFDCLEIAEAESREGKTEPREPRPLTAAEIVARRLKDVG